MNLIKSCIGATKSIVSPKHPIENGWKRGPDIPPHLTEGYPHNTWQFHPRGLCVLSAVVVAQTERGAEDIGPCYLLSISCNKAGKAARCSSAEASWVLSQFGLDDAEEDNHVPGGIARCFWRPVADRFSGYECPCKDSEIAIVEDKGDFVWRPV